MSEGGRAREREKEVGNQSERKREREREEGSQGEVAVMGLLDHLLPLAQRLREVSCKRGGESESEGEWASE